MLLEGIKKYYKKYDCRILIVDVHSKDKSLDIARNLWDIVVYQNEKGYEDTLNTDFLYALEYLEPTIFIKMDGDGTYDIEDSTKLMDMNKQLCIQCTNLIWSRDITYSSKKKL